jgi:hypothetical protein
VQRKKAMSALTPIATAKADIGAFKLFAVARRDVFAAKVERV